MLSPLKIRLDGLPDRVRLEVAVAVQRVIGGHSVRKLHPHILGALLNRLREHQAQVQSLTQPLPPALVEQFTRGRRDIRGVLTGVREILRDFGSPDDAAAEFDRDVWRLRLLGYPEQRRAVIRFDGILQSWLRQHAKRFLRWRIGTGLSYGQIPP